MWHTPTIKETTKEVDQSFQTAQRYLNQGLKPLVTLMELLQHDKEEEFKLAKDAFQLLAYAHGMLWEQLIKQTLYPIMKRTTQNDKDQLSKFILSTLKSNMHISSLCSQHVYKV